MLYFIINVFVENLVTSGFRSVCPLKLYNLFAYIDFKLERLESIRAPRTCFPHTARGRPEKIHVTNTNYNVEITNTIWFFNIYFRLCAQREMFRFYYDMHLSPASCFHFRLCTTFRFEVSVLSKMLSNYYSSVSNLVVVL